MKTIFILTALMLGASSVALRAQIVADGATNTLSNVTNTFTGDVTVGTNGSFTLLVLSDNALLTNSANGFIGRNTTAKFNEVRLLSPTARWVMGSHLFVGNDGSFNRLVVSNGATARNNNGYLGPNAPSSNNVAVVTGPGSVWSNANVFYLGFNGAGNQLVVSNGGVLRARASDVGVNSSSSNNLAVVTGSGSLWSNAFEIQFGAGGAGNQLVISNGGVLRSSLGYLGAGAPGSNNLAVVTGSNSLWTNTTELYVGHSGAGNQLVVSEGGVVRSGHGYVGANTSGSNNLALVTGSGTVWSNSLDLEIGAFSGNNQMIVSNGATVFTAGTGLIGPTANGNANSATVTGPGTSWLLSSNLFVGSNGAFNLLVVRDGGRVANYNGALGFGTSSSNNLAWVTGVSSSWTNLSELHVGDRGSGNQLVVSNGATVFTRAEQIIGDSGGANSNLILVTDAGSRCLAADGLYVGRGSAFNRLIVTNGGLMTVVNESALIGSSSGANSNQVLVTGAGSMCRNEFDMLVGGAGSANQLVVSDAGLVVNSNGFLGFSASSSNNTALVTGSGSIWSNRSTLAVGDSGSANRLVVSNGGTIFTAGVGSIGNRSSGTSNAALVTGPGASWLLSSNLYVGSNGASSQLVISDGARVGNVLGTIGKNVSSSNNVAVVMGSGSVWSHADDLYVGYSGSGNQLVVSNAGVVQNGVGYVGYDSSNNLAVVTGAGSAWSNAFTFVVGVFGAGNRMVVSDGAIVLNDSGYLGLTASSSNNVVLVTGPGSIWSTTFNLSLGQAGAGTQLVVSNGGTVFAGNNMYLGADANSINNRVVVDGGTLRTTNSQGGSVFDIRRGTSILNAGLIEADELLLTNGAGFLQFNGGTLSVANSRISNGTLFVVGNGVNPATFLLAGNGLHEFTGILAAQVRSNATFAGNGTITGPIPLQLTQGSRLAPGAPVGTMVFSNAPGLHGTVVMEISKSGLTLTNDQIQVIAPLTYGGSLVVNNLGPNAPAVGDRFRLFNANGYTGGFTNIVLPPLPPGLGWTNKLLVDGSIEVIEGPKFTSITLSGSNIIIAGTNGPPNVSYTVFTATNVAAPMSDWLSLATNQFGPGGEFAFTNALTTGEPQRYFRIRTP